MVGACARNRTLLRDEMASSIRAVITYCLGVALISCSMLPSQVCTTEGQFSVLVDIQDSVTKAPLASGATVRLESSTHVDTLPVIIEGSASDDQRRIGIGRNAGGTFTVSVQKAGYRPWSQSGVVVEVKGACNRVRTVTLVADLQAS